MTDNEIKQMEEINRLNKACKTAIESYTRMETLYKIKCNELEYSINKAENDTAKNILQYLYERIGNVALSDIELIENLALQYNVELEK